MLTESQTVGLPDNLSEDELDVQVESEAHRLLSAVQAVNFVCRDRPQRNRGGIGVRVTAANSDRVQGTRSPAAEMAGLKPHRDGRRGIRGTALRSADPLGVSADISATDAKELPVVAVIHLGGSRSKAIFYQGWKELYEQSLNSYGDQLTRSAARMFTLDALKAEIKEAQEHVAGNLAYPVARSLPGGAGARRCMGPCAASCLLQEHRPGRRDPALGRLRPLVGVRAQPSSNRPRSPPRWPTCSRT
ncbi:pilus assembly protein PilM [Cupriavidus basilensis]